MERMTDGRKGGRGDKDAITHERRTHDRKKQEYMGHILLYVLYGTEKQRLMGQRRKNEQRRIE